MPYSLRRTAKGWGVLNTRTGKWKSRNTSKSNAEGQLRLLQGLESGSIKPSEVRSNKRKPRKKPKRKRS